MFSDPIALVVTSLLQMRVRTIFLPRHRAPVLLLAIVALTAVGCHHKRRAARVPQITPPRATHPSPEVKVGHTEQGVASWYGIPYHGRPAADGEIYDMEKLVAAHRLLPFNTWLRVTNLKNSKSVEVRVIDRGPFVDGRIIDLSKAAARQIDLLGPGVAPVRLEVISAPVSIRSNDQYALQLGAFSVYANAEHARTEAVTRFGSAEIKLRQGNAAPYRVLAGHWSSPDEAQTAAAQWARDGKTAFVVRLDETVGGTPTEQTAAPHP